MTRAVRYGVVHESMRDADVANLARQGRFDPNLPWFVVRWDAEYPEDGSELVEMCETEEMAQRRAQAWQERVPYWPQEDSDDGAHSVGATS